MARHNRAFGLADVDPPIVVASIDRDDWLVAAREKVDGEADMHDRDSAIGALTAQLAQWPGRDTIELLSHSNDDNLLVVGDWTLGSPAFGGADPRSLELLRGKTIRLVGCSTARGTKATAVLRDLEDRLGARAYGARGLVGTLDLIDTGSDPRERDGLFAQASAGGETSNAPYVVQEAELRRAGDPRPFPIDARDALLRGRAQKSAERLDAALGDLLTMPYYVFPGLLRRPTYTRLLAPVDPGHRAGRIDWLFEGQLVRLVPPQPGGHARPSEYLSLVGDAAARARLQALIR